MTDDHPVQFGIVGAGRISANALVPALAAAANAELAAAASRDLARAEALKPQRAYAGYDALLEDPDVEAVYIGTHNGLHHPLTIQALECGKHVLCEKPLACNASQCREMADAARQHQRHLMEAFMYRYHPQIAFFVDQIREGVIGDVMTVEVAFSAHFGVATDVRFNPDWGGGAVLDIGSYCVNACRLVFEDVPQFVTAMAAIHPVHRVDMSLHGVLNFGGDRFGVISCGFDAGFRNHVLACGTRGTLTMPRAFASSRERVRVALDVEGRVKETAFEPVDTYRLQVEDFARAVRGGPAPLLGPEDGYQNARVIDALLASAQAGATTAVKI